MKKDKDSIIRAGLIAFIGALVVLLAVIIFNIVGQTVSSTQAAFRRTTLWRGDEQGDAIDLDSAYGLGLERAREWSNDVQLVRAEAAWRPTRDGQKLDQPPVSWSLYFYSPQERALACVHVTDEQVFWVPPIPLGYAPKIIGQLPSQSVEVVWLTFRADGGDDYLLRHKDAMINFRLHSKDGVLVWSASAFDERGKYSVVIDAQTGTIIQDIKN